MKRLLGIGLLLLGLLVGGCDLLSSEDGGGGEERGGSEQGVEVTRADG